MWVGGNSVGAKELNVSEMVSFVLAAVDVVQYAGFFPSYIEQIAKGIGASRRVLFLLDRKDEHRTVYPLFPALASPPPLLIISTFFVERNNAANKRVTGRGDVQECILLLSIKKASASATGYFLHDKTRFEQAPNTTFTTQHTQPYTQELVWG